MTLDSLLLQGAAERGLRAPLRGHDLLRVLHHHQLHDRHQHVHRHHPRELQPGPPGGGDRHRRGGPRDVLHKVVKVSEELNWIMS